MIPRRYSKRRLALYLLTPIFIGLGGVVFSQQWDNLAIRTMVLLASVAVPVFAGGSLWVRYRSSRLERIVLLVGVLMLIVGAVLSVSGLPGTLETKDVLPDLVTTGLQILGAGSLLLGLFVVLYTVVRAGEDIGEVGERFRNLAELISEGFILTGPDGTIVLVNDQFLTMFGLAREEVLGQNAMTLTQRYNVSEINEHIVSRTKGIASEYEVAWRVRGEERRFWFNGRPIFDRNGRYTATLATVRDITELHRLSQRVELYAHGLQKLVEEQTQKLQASEERFRQLLISMNEGFLTIDSANRIRFANDHICKILAIAPDQILGRDIFDFVEPLSRGRLMSLLMQGATMEHSELRQEVVFVDTGNDLVPAMVAVAYLRGAAGEEPVYSVVVTSLLDQKEMQRQLEARARELERVNEELRLHDRAKDMFLSNVSHELRTPLSTIQGYVEMLESGNLGPISGPQTSATKVMSRNVERLLGLINEMIEFSRMEIRGLQINVDLFSPGRLAHESLAFVHPHALAKNITLNIFVSDPMPHAWGDREKLGQVLGVLLNNAVKFTDPGGMIQVHVSIRGEGTLAFAVSDTGIGIDPKFQSRVFEKFFQVDSSKTRRYEGTGIGLSIAKAIVEKHQGSIEVSSTQGQGSTFTVVLPEAIFNEAHRPEDFDSLSQSRVLVIDQGQGLFETLNPLFEHGGVSLQVAPNGFEGVRYASSLLPHIILINDSPADVAGLGTIGLLRQNPATADIPVIVLTGESAERIREAQELWRDIVFIKRRFNFSTLLAQMHLVRQGEAFLHVTESLTPQHDIYEHRPFILVVDTDPGLLDWLEMVLRRRQIPCGCARTVPDALAFAHKQSPDIVFLDIDIPGDTPADRISALTQMPALHQVPIYVMTGMPGAGKDLDGIAGILHKPFSLEEVTQVVQSHIKLKSKKMEHPAPARDESNG